MLNYATASTKDLVPDAVRALDVIEDVRNDLEALSDTLLAVAESRCAITPRQLSLASDALALMAGGLGEDVAALETADEPREAESARGKPDEDGAADLEQVDPI